MAVSRQEMQWRKCKNFEYSFAPLRELSLVLLFRGKRVN